MTSLQGAGGSAANAGVLYYGAREYKDFELSVDYRGAATNSNGGVLLRFPKPTAITDADRSGYQVAILDNGTTATRTGAVLQERPALSYATSSATNFKPTREWNTLNITAIGGQITVRLNGVQVSQYNDATRRSGYIGLENAGTGVMYRNVRVREIAPDTVAPTVTNDVPASIPLGGVVPATFACADESELASCTATLDGLAPIVGGRATEHSVVRFPHAGRHRDRRRGSHHGADADLQRRDGGLGHAGGERAADALARARPPPAFGAFAPGRRGTRRVDHRDRHLDGGDAVLSVSNRAGSPTGGSRFPGG